MQLYRQSDLCLHRRWHRSKQSSPGPLCSQGNRAWIQHLGTTLPKLPCPKTLPCPTLPDPLCWPRSASANTSTHSPHWHGETHATPCAGLPSSQDVTENTHGLEQVTCFGLSGIFNCAVNCVFCLSLLINERWRWGESTGGNFRWEIVGDKMVKYLYFYPPLFSPSEGPLKSKKAHSTVHIDPRDYVSCIWDTDHAILRIVSWE